MKKLLIATAVSAAALLSLLTGATTYDIVIENAHAS